MGLWAITGRMVGSLIWDFRRHSGAAVGCGVRLARLVPAGVLVRHWAHEFALVANAAWWRGERSPIA
jgi:hypothetical protein